MINWRSLLSICMTLSSLVATAPCAAPPQPPAQVGESAPTFYLLDPDGEEFYLREWSAPEGEQLHPYRRRERHMVVLSFFATWCVPCREELPALQELSRRYEGQLVLWRIVDVQESLDSVSTFLERLGVRLPVLLDRHAKVAENYCGDPMTVPTTAVIDRDGIVQYLEHGYNESTMVEIQRTLDRILNSSSTMPRRAE